MSVMLFVIFDCDWIKIVLASGNELRTHLARTPVRLWKYAIVVDLLTQDPTRLVQGISAYLSRYGGEITRMR
ncbi:hypothetical protein PG993_010398 [Apiospora rasikravindrae]|uniref:Uncharacterized protein n=1 Tax=Apiospora rasikravindrae TaxID=990691 RepID=A0ABR1SPG7_9PEZI